MLIKCFNETPNNMQKLWLLRRN